MAALDDCKTLLGISGNSKDTVLTLYIRRAVTAIKTYLNAESINPETDYPDAVAQCVMEAVQRQGNEGLNQFMQGSRQGTYEKGLSDEVKALLPLPFIQMCGGS